VRVNTVKKVYMVESVNIGGLIVGILVYLRLKLLGNCEKTKISITSVIYARLTLELQVDSSWEPSVFANVETIRTDSQVNPFP